MEKVSFNMDSAGGVLPNESLIASCGVMSASSLLSKYHLRASQGHNSYICFRKKIGYKLD